MSGKKHGCPLRATPGAAWILCTVLATACLCVAQQSLPQLQITSPADGTIVNPGQTISVTVTSPANIALRFLIAACARCRMHGFCRLRPTGDRPANWQYPH